MISDDNLAIIILSLFAVIFIVFVAGMLKCYSINKMVQERHPAIWRKFDSPEIKFNFWSLFGVGYFRNGNSVLNLLKMIPYLLARDSKGIDKELVGKISRLKLFIKIGVFLFVIPYMVIFFYFVITIK